MPVADVDLVGHLADHVAGTTYERLPPVAVEAAKKSIFDTLGVTLAASGVEPAVQGVVDLVRETGGRPEATVLAFGDRVPALTAAFANGAMAHCLDFDDQPHGVSTRPAPSCLRPLPSPSGAAACRAGK